MPNGPVTPGKAWIEMVHRYLAMGVGVLITVLAVAAWLGRKSPARPDATLSWWPALTLVWVCIQGAFGALMVTMKLFPAIVTLHLLGGYGLLAMLTVQTAQLAPHSNRPVLGSIPHEMRRWIAWGLALLLVQAASGAWVSTNYAVLACTGFPTCQGAWWPLMDFAGGFEIWRPLGLGGWCTHQLPGIDRHPLCAPGVGGCYLVIFRRPDSDPQSPPSAEPACADPGRPAGASIGNRVKQRGARVAIGGSGFAYGWCRGHGCGHGLVAGIHGVAVQWVAAIRN